MLSEKMEDFQSPTRRLKTSLTLSGNKRPYHSLSLIYFTIHSNLTHLHTISTLGDYPTLNTTTKLTPYSVMITIIVRLYSYPGASTVSSLNISLAQDKTSQRNEHS